MADYYSIIAKAVRALDPNTGDARRRLYDRARGALLGEMRSVELALNQADILAARMSLEEAIGRVEADVLLELRARQEAEAPVAADAVTPDRRTMPDGGQGRSPLAKLWTQLFRRAGDRAERVEPHAGHGETPFGRSPGETHPGKGRDTWMTELLARASREEDEGDDQAIAPRREIRRSR
jgi:hypothetical protein